MPRIEDWDQIVSRTAHAVVGVDEYASALEVAADPRDFASKYASRA